MLDSYDDCQSINIGTLDTKNYEDIFYLRSNHNSELDISINEDYLKNFPSSQSFSKTKETKNIYSISSSNCSATELKRKKNREASKLSRLKKKDDIINLVKTNELLREKIKFLSSQVDNNICSECKKRLSRPTSLFNSIAKDTQENKPQKLTITSNSSLNASPIRAKTAMFISMVVIFCVIVNSFGDKSRNYLRKATMNNYYNGFFNHIEMNRQDSSNISQCLDLLRYHYNINKQVIDVNPGNKGNEIDIILEKQKKTTKCQRNVTKLRIPEINAKNIKESFQLKIIAKKEFLITKLFQDEDTFQEEPDKPNYYQIECFDIHLLT